MVRVLRWVAVAKGFYIRIREANVAQNVIAEGADMGSAHGAESPEPLRNPTVPTCLFCTSLSGAPRRVLLYDSHGIVLFRLFEPILPR